MTKFNQPIEIKEIENLIFTIRGIQVMLDAHLAEMYGISTGRLNEQVKRNKERFPESFMFQLTSSEFEHLKSQNAIFNEPAKTLRSQNAIIKNQRGKHRKYLPFVFTEQGVAMLSAVLRSPEAVRVSIQIMQAFVEMRKFILGNATLFQRIDRIELKLLEADGKFEQLFRALEKDKIRPDKGIFFDGQVFDAYTFVAELIRSAKESIILVDNYVDDSVLVLLSKRNDGVSATIFTKNFGKQLQLDLEKHNSQYPEISVKEFADSHDRFLIIDSKELYHFGASLKDLGKKWFAFSKIDAKVVEFIHHLFKV